MSACRVLVATHLEPNLGKVRQALGLESGFVVCAEERTAVGAIASAIRETPDLCLIDMDVPGGGTAAAWEIAARLPRVKIVLVAGSYQGSALVLALAAGASGVIARDGNMERLPAVLTSVMNGEVAIPRAAVAQIVSELADRRARRRSVPISAEPDRLTSREWEVLDLVCGGEGTALIARRLDVSQATVRSHVARALRKLGHPNRDSAVRALGRR